MDNRDMKVKDLKNILNNLPDEMRVIIPVVSEFDVDSILGFRKVRTAGILRCDMEVEEEREVLCLNGATKEFDIAEQIRFSGKDVDSLEVLFGKV